MMFWMLLYSHLQVIDCYFSDTLFLSLEKSGNSCDQTWVTPLNCALHFTVEGCGGYWRKRLLELSEQEVGESLYTYK
jgi:hypothetical protein